MARHRFLRALTLVVAVALVLGACDRGKEPVSGGAKEEPPKVAEAKFELGEVRATDPQDRPDSHQKAQDAAAKVVSMLNRFYTVAFLDPALWQNGQHPELAALFTGEAQPSVAPNLAHLAMSDLSDKIESVQPTTQRVDRVSFTVEPDGTLPLGVATVTFQATGKSAGGGDDVAITHQAYYFLQREGEDYKISAYSTALNAGAPQ